jgi:hypothetical protein
MTMAANAQWVAFCGLLDIDASNPQNSGSNSSAANNLKTALQAYMDVRFHTSDITYLVDIINAQDVIDAIVANLTHISADDVAIRAAVADVFPATTKAITVFDIAGQVGSTDIDEEAKTIGLLAPFGANVTALSPTITITGVSVSPASGVAQDFTSPVNYTVTAEDASTQIYVVTVTIAPE